MPSFTATDSLWRWTRMTTTKWEDSWAERLAFLGPGQTVFVGWPGSSALKIEAYGSRKTVVRLVERFGGKASRMRIWRRNAAKPRAPLNIRGRLRIFADKAEWEAWPSKSRKPCGLFVPAGMAFGTGEHVTTASCLRFLCDTVGRLPERWSALDAGTGSGILAVAAEKLGAARIDAFDCDPVCVRTAKANVRVNRCRLVRVFEADVLGWCPETQYDFIMANLFSDLLIEAAPRLRESLRAGGAMIFSGVLKSQREQVFNAFQSAGFRLQRSLVRGKWSAGLCEKAG